MCQCGTWPLVSTHSSLEFFYCLVVLNPLFWQALPSMAIVVQGESAVALLYSVFCFPVMSGLKRFMFWAQGCIPLSD